jgi:uncharacterized membrane protein
MERIGDRKIVIGLMLLQLAICIPFLDSFPIDLDEPFSIFWSQQDLSTFIPEIGKGNNSPLHFISLHFWIKLFGTGAIAVRSLSLFFSLLTIPVIFNFGKKIIGKEGAIITCIFFIFSTFMHYHSMEARMYSLMILLSVLAIHDLYSVLFENKKIFWRLAIWNVLLFYTHYLSVFLFLTEFALVLVMMKELNKKNIIQLVLAGLVMASMIYPGVSALLIRAKAVGGGDNWVPMPNLSALYGNVIRFFNYTLSFSIIFGFIVVFGIVNRKIIALNLKNTLQNRKFRFVILAFVIPYLAMYISSLLITPVFLDRYILFTTPFLYLSVAIAITVVLQDVGKRYLKLVFIIPIIASCYYIPQTNRDGEKLAQFVKESKNNGDQIVICPPFYDITFIYHFDQQIFEDYLGIEESMESNDIYKIYSYEDIDTDNYVNRLIFVDANSKFLYEGNNILSKLDSEHTYLESQNFKGDMVVYIYQL